MTSHTFMRGFRLACAVIAFAVGASAACNSVCRPDGTQASGAKYRICTPEPPCGNGNLVIYAHGYVDFTKPIAIPEDQLTLPDGTYLPALVNSLGFGFATTSYSANGLAVVEGVEDVRDLIDVYTSEVGPPGKVYLAGPSEGGLVTVKAIEKYPSAFTGGLAVCGAIGNMLKQVEYIGDFRVLFDAYFRGVIPGGPVVIPGEVIANWETVYLPNARAAVQANPGRAAELVKVARVPTGGDPANIEDAVLSTLWYSIFATNDLNGRVGGNSYSNIGKWYTGSSNDLWLNTHVVRVASEPAAVQKLQDTFDTRGDLSVQMVTMHTTADQILPYWVHEPAYALKVALKGNADKHVNLPIFRYGHCEFNAAEVVFGFGLLVLRTSGQQLPGMQVVPPSIGSVAAPN